MNMMDQKQLFKQMIDFNKSSFNNTFSAMVMVQDQMEAMTSSTMQNANWLPAEGKKAVREWVDACKMGREEYKKAVDNAFQKVEDFFK